MIFYANERKKYFLASARTKNGIMYIFDTQKPGLTPREVVFRVLEGVPRFRKTSAPFPQGPQTR